MSATQRAPEPGDHRSRLRSARGNGGHRPDRPEFQGRLKPRAGAPALDSLVVRARPAMERSPAVTAERAAAGPAAPAADLPDA